MIGFPRKLLCLDWDKRSLRFVVARVGSGSFQLEDAHWPPIPSSVDVEDPQSLGAFIAHALTTKRVHCRRAVIDVPRDRAVINRLSLPPTPPEELPSAVRFQALKELPFPVDESAIDYLVLESDGEGRATEVLLAAVRNETIEKLKATCAAAGLELARVGLRPCANLVSISAMPGRSERRVMLVEVGPNMTEIDVFRAGVLAFSRSASVSVPFLAGDLVSDDSRVSARSEWSERERTEDFEAAAVNELLVEVTRTLQAYRATEPNSAVDEVVIAGGTGVEPALMQAIGRRFSLPTALFDPTPILGTTAGDAAKLRPLSAVIGLGLGIGRDGRLPIDFLHPKKPVPRGRSVRRRLQLGGAVAAAVVVAGVGWAANEVIRLNRQIASLDALVDPRDGTLTQQVRSMTELEIRTKEVDLWADEARDAVWLDHLLTLTQRAIEPGKQMLVETIDFRRATGTIRLRISAGGNQVASEFVRQLNEIQLDGRPIYRAALGTWQDGGAVDPRFKGRVDVTVELLELEEHNDPARIKQRERDHKKLLNV